MSSFITSHSTHTHELLDVPQAFSKGAFIFPVDDARQTKSFYELGASYELSLAQTRFIRLTNSSHLSRDKHGHAQEDKCLVPELPTGLPLMKALLNAALLSMFASEHVADEDHF